ncbi:MAG: DAHL domain-containing protein [Hansschlegelia sp.]
MKRTGAAALFIGFMLLLSIYLGTRGAFPDADLNQRVLISLIGTFLDDAALQRDVLLAREGSLGNYDVLNEHIADLRRAAVELRAASSIASGEAKLGLDEALGQLVSAIDAKEDLVERFKANLALTRNSMRIFIYAAERINDMDSGRSGVRSPAVSQTTVAILAFLERPGLDNRDRAISALKALDIEISHGDVPSEIKGLSTHGMLLLNYVPTLGYLTSEIQGDAVEEKARSLRSKYLEAYNESEMYAGRVQLFILISAIVLCVYNFMLITRLAVGTKRLERRSSLEQAAATISSRFIALPWRETDDAIRFGLERLAEQTGVEKIDLLVFDGDERIEEQFRWPPSGPGVSDEEMNEILAFGQGDVEPRIHSVIESEGRAEQSCAVLNFPLAGPKRSMGYLILRTTNKRARFVDDDRALLGVVGEIFRSALDRLHREEERQALQTQLSRAQRLEALGTLAGSVAHEFNNILGAIRGHAEFASDLIRRDGPVRRHIGQILTASARAQTVIDRVLTFGRRRGEHNRPFDASVALEEVLTLLRASLPAGIKFEKTIVDGVILDGEVTELQQIVLNLCTNAAHAMDGDGVIVIDLSTASLDKERTLSHGHLAAGRYACLKVLDQGGGIEPAMLDRIFEPFFTTKKIGVGTGLGLSTVHDIVQTWGGGMNVSSVVGIGTAMHVYLPVSRRTLSEGPVEWSSRGRGETILIVELDRHSLERDEEILAALGYEPVGFTDAGQALAAVRAEPERFQIGLVDDRFLSEGGVDLPRRIAEVGSGLALLLIASSAEEADVAYLEEVGVRDVLRRPLRLRDIADALARRQADA